MGHRRGCTGPDAVTGVVRDASVPWLVDDQAVQALAGARPGAGWRQMKPMGQMGEMWRVGEAASKWAVTNVMEYDE